MAKIKKAMKGGSKVTGKKGGKRLESEQERLRLKLVNEQSIRAVLVHRDNASGGRFHVAAADQETTVKQDASPSRLWLRPQQEES